MRDIVAAIVLTLVLSSCQATGPDPTGATTIPTQSQREEGDAEAHDAAMCGAAAASIQDGTEFMGFVEDARLPLQVPAYLADGTRESVLCHREDYPYVMEVSRTDPSSRTFLAPPDATAADVAQAVQLSEEGVYEIDDGVFTIMAPPEDDPSGARPLPIDALVAERTVTSGVGIDPEAPQPTAPTVPSPERPGILLINDMGVEAWATGDAVIGYYIDDRGFTATQSWGEDLNEDPLGFQVHFGFDESDEVTVHGVAPIDTTAVRMSFAGTPPIYVTRLFERPQAERNVFVGTFPLDWLVEAEEGGLELTAMSEGGDFTPELLVGGGFASTDSTRAEQVGDIFRTPQPLVIETQTVRTLPEADVCGEDMREAGTADVGSHPTQDQALQTFISDLGHVGLEGWIKVKTDSGEPAFVLPFYPTPDPSRYQPLEKGVVMVAELEETPKGWTVTDWESSGC